MSSEQQEEVGELSRMEEVCEEGEIIVFEVLACLLRVLRLYLSVASYHLMEPTGDSFAAGPFPDLLPSVEQVSRF